MIDIEALERVAGEERNHGRARAFGVPVLRSVHPDALLVGYSVTGGREGSDPGGVSVDRVVEANHVSRASLATESPVAFTVRSWKFFYDLENELVSHAVDHVMNAHPGPVPGRWSRGDREDLRAEIRGAARGAVSIEVDGVEVEGVGYSLRGSVFVTALVGSGGTVVSIAAPEEFVAGGFSSAVPG